MGGVNFKTIVATSDLSEIAEEGLSHAAQIAASGSATRLYLLHVVAPAEMLLGREYGLGLEITKQALKEIHDAAEQKLAEQWKKVAPASYAGPSPKLMTVSGSPAAEICDFADSVKADLIVIGTHGRTGLGHLLIGSVAENVVRHAPCAVLTVRLPQKPKKAKKK